MNILITRPLIDAEDLMGKLFSLGHKIIHMPTLKISSIKSVKVDFKKYDAIILTSANALRNLKVINNEYLLLEMYIIQLCHLEGMREFSPSEQQSDNLVVENKGNKLKTQTNKDEDIYSKTIKDQLKSTQQIKTSVEKFFIINLNY